jgi:hypothetical protein
MEDLVATTAQDTEIERRFVSQSLVAIVMDLESFTGGTHLASMPRSL